MITYGSITLTSYNSIVTTTIYYYQSISPTDLIGGTWSTTKPEWEEGTYVWQKLRTIYEDGTFSEGDAVNITGQQGKSGEAASSYKLTSSESAIALLKTGEYSTNQITFNATYKQGNNPIAPYNGGFVIQYSTNGAEWVTDYTSLNNESSKTYTIPENILIIKCLLYQTKDCDELLDIVTIPIIKDGIDGTGVTNSFPIYLVSDKDKGITFDDHGWTRFKPSLDAENKYLWIDYVSRYAEGNTKPQLIEKTGNKITFEYHGERSPFESVIIDITPVQSGSGTPSSRNKRHISGWTSIDIGQADINLMSYEEGKYMLDLPEDIATLDNQTLNLENTMFTIQGDTLIITKGDLGTHITFPEEVGTVYGGKYNVTTGVLMVTHGYIDKYNNEPLPSTWISDRNVYVKGTKPSIDAQVVFELNEPLIYELTPQEIMIFEHSNSIYASTGDISISYYDYQTTTSPYIDYALVSAFDASTAALEEATQLKQDFQELQEDIQTQLDQKVETWCQINDPALSWTTTDLKQQHNGDLWYYIGKSNISYKNNTTYKYVASTGEWMPYAVSADLFDKIDGKAAIYYGTTSSVTSAEEGDYLVDSTDGSSYRWNNGAWVKVTDYKTAINNIQIGGRNLFITTSRFHKEENAFITESNKKDNYVTRFNNSSIYTSEPFYEGESIILQAESNLPWNTRHAYDGTAPNTVGFWLQAYDTKEDAIASTNLRRSQFLGGENATSFKKVWIVPAADNGKYYNFRFNSYADGTNIITAKFWDLKLERGNKPTDWTPAPEDVEEEISNLRTDLQSQIDEKIQTFYQSTNPASSWTTTELRTSHDGDLWYYTGTTTSTYIKDNVYRYNASNNTWSVYSASGELFDKVDGKSTIYYGTTSGTYTGVETGDYLVDSTDGSSYRYDGSKWVKVTDYQTTITNAIDNIQIGGKNLALDSSLTGNIQKWNPTVNRWTKTIKDGHECLMCEGSLNTTATLTVPLTINSESYGVVPYNGLQLVFSADVLLEDVIKGTTNFYLALYGSGQTIDGTWRGATPVKNSPYMIGSSIIPNELNGIGWTRVWYIFKYDDYNWSAYLRPTFYARDFTGKVYVKNIKVEYGDYATDWTPAPEDTQADIDTALTTATAYITDTTDNGIMVHPENDTTSGWSIASAIQLFKSGISYIKLWIENNVAKIRIGREDEGHVLIDNDSVDIKKGQDVLASFGESTYIGKNNGYHMLISPNDFIGISDSNAEYFKISGYISTKTLSSNETITETTGYRTGRYFSYRLLNTPLDSSTVSVQEVFYDENYTELNARHFEQVYHYEAPSSDPDMTTWKWEENISEIPAGVGNRPQQQLTIDEELFDQENGLEIGVHLSEASVKYVVFRVTYKPANSTVAVVNPYYTFGYRKDDYNVGVYSFAEGANIIASGEHSHAEGEDTIASGQGSHAEGAVTTANGDYSHIEGYNGTANGNLSHVEGEACIANGSTSHAQGVGTIADSDAQMVLGRFNMPDSSNKYAVIVGNGDINRRSDAFRLTWDGDLLFFYQNNNPSQGTLDYDLKQAINALNWGGDIIVG